MQTPHWFVRLIHSRYTYLFVGVTLVCCGIFELFEDYLQDVAGIKIGAHHGLIIVGLFQAVNAVVAIVQGHQIVLPHGEPSGKLEKGSE